MSPEERNKMDKLEKMVMAMYQANDVAFIESMKRRLNVPIEVANAISQTKLTQLADVDTTGVTDGQVIKYNLTEELWENANDNTA